MNVKKLFFEFVHKERVAPNWKFVIMKFFLIIIAIVVAGCILYVIELIRFSGWLPKIGISVLIVWGPVSLWLLIKEYCLHMIHPEEPKVIDGE